MLVMKDLPRKDLARLILFLDAVFTVSLSFAIRLLLRVAIFYEAIGDAFLETNAKMRFGKEIKKPVKLRSDLLTHLLITSKLFF